MNGLKILNVCFVALLFVATSCSSEQEKKEVNQNNASNTAIDVIHKRVSIRNYTDQEISKEQLETIVCAGMAAPSAMNKQPWQFVVIDDENILSAIGEIPTSRMAKNAPAAILVCGDLQKAGEGWLQQYWIQDCSAVSQNILLAVTDMGLGAVWTGIYPAEDRMKTITDLLKLPEHIIPFCVIPLGYPSQENQPKDKWNPENVHWNKW
jgi:nitroreductase